MVNNAAIVSVVQKITVKKGPPCKKTLQKIIFLIEAKQVDLGFDYGIHFYGPYSADLDFAVRKLSDDGILHIEYTAMEHNISVLDGEIAKDYSEPVIDDVVEEFGTESPNELELLATTLYVYLKVKDLKKTKEGVIKIKGSKYSRERIDNAIERLKNAEYISA